MKTILLISPYWKEENRWMISTYKLAQLWQNLGYKVVVVCMAKSTGVEHISKTLILYKKKDFFLPDPLNFGIAFGFMFTVFRAIKEQKPDTIVINKILFWTSWSIVPLRIFGYKPIVLTDALVGMTWWPRTLLPKIIMGIGGWTMGWLTLLLAKKIVFFHPQPDSLLRRLGVAGKSMVIPTGIDVSSYESDTRNQQPVTSQKQKIAITYVGRLESVKGVDDFLAAVVPLKNQYPDIEIQVVGFYEEENMLVEKYHGQVAFTGLRDDIPDILAATDIFVLPSYSEGLSNALMEAMSSSCACIASDVGGNKYLLQNGVSGFLFPAGDRQALAAHIERLLNDPEKMNMLAKAARSRIEKEFDWKIIGKRYQELFDTCII